MKSFKIGFLGFLSALLLCGILSACGDKTPPAETEAPSDTAPAASDTLPAEESNPETAPDTSLETLAQTEPETIPETEPETFPVYEEVAGNVRVQLYSPTVLRIEEAVGGAFCDDTTIAVTNRQNWNGVAVTRTQADGVIQLATDTYIVTIPADAEKATDVKVNAPDGESLWNSRLSSKAEATLPEPAKTRRSWSFNDSPRVRVPANGFTEIRTDADNGFVLEQSVADYYIFVCEKDPFTLRADYNRLVGACEMVTVKTLGLWFSRFYAYRDVELLRLVADYRRRGFPLDYVVVDTDWRVGSSTGYDINTYYFPDMENFLTKMHEQQVQVAFNDHVRDYSGSLLSAEQLRWFNQNLTDILDLGLDTWWYDRNWHYTLQSPLAGIHGDMLGQMMYLSIMQKHNAPLNRRTVMLSNYYTDVHSRLTLPSYIGTHRYSVQWSGDITAVVLPRELENMVRLGALTSTAYVSSDIGGHLYSPTDEMYIRWTQYGALSPIMRYHSSGDDRSPWKYGSVAEVVAKRYVRMRYNLMPLFYTLAYENYAEGLPLARRLDFYYPQHTESAANDQYLLGEDILVAPITEGDRAVPAEWLTAPDGTPGVEITYYNNQNLAGNPIRTDKAAAIDFDWGTNSPAAGVGGDNFSAVVRTTLTVGDYDICLGTISDDGVRVYVDDRRVIDFWQASDSTAQFNRTTILKAHTAYEIRVEYYEGAGDARLRLLGVPADLDADADKVAATRTVFIPDGQWMDVFSGKVYTGPETVTVTHSIETSPVFVRLGSILAVAGTYHEYADTSHWQTMGLDVYPAEGMSDTTRFYEDDGQSLDYQAGKYRITELASSTVDGKTTIRISPAKGDYTTAWSEREWIIRLHASEVRTVTVNGESVSFERSAERTDGEPFSVTGGTPDGDTVVFKITLPVDKAASIVIE